MAWMPAGRNPESMGADRLSGRSTTATRIGRAASKLLMVAFLLIETTIVYIYFGDRVIAGFLALGALWFVVDAFFVWKKNPYSPAQMRLFMWGWNAAAITGILWNWMHSSLTSLHLLTRIQP